MAGETNLHHSQTSENGIVDYNLVSKISGPVDIALNCACEGKSINLFSLSFAATLFIASRFVQQHIEPKALLNSGILNHAA